MPTYNHNFALLRFGGSAWIGNEEWSCGLKLKHLGGADLAPMHQEAKDTIDDVVVATQAYVARAASKFAFGSILKWVKVNVIDATTGRYAYPNDVVLVEGLNTSGTGGNGIPQVALAITMRGGYARGTAAYGRWFIPCGTETLETDGQITVASAIAAAGSAVTYLKALQSIDSGLGPDAWSPWLYGSGQSGNRDSAIISVECGRVYDTQRRRRSSLVEDHQLGAGWP